MRDTRLSRAPGLVLIALGACLIVLASLMGCAGLPPRDTRPMDWDAVADHAERHQEASWPRATSDVPSR